jgi:sulfur carrier protein
MTITLNGEPYELPGPLSIAALLERLNIDARLVAVEHNRVIVRRQRHAETMIHEGAEVEIVAFVSGGAPGKPGPQTRRAECDNLTRRRH